MRIMITGIGIPISHKSNGFMMRRSCKFDVLRPNAISGILVPWKNRWSLVGVLGL